jgi:ankyrin repeat protein
VFCQLEVLRHCLPASIRQTLDQLPRSLDETYLRVLSQISQANQAHAHRMLQCLVVAVRPLLVGELAELLAFEFDAAQGGIPKYRAAWRLDDQTQAVLSTCSSLVTIVDDEDYGQIVQFSHFSVKEFLISNRLTSPLGDFSGYQIHPGPAHTILTQACLGVLLHLDDHIDEESVEEFPLAEYAAQHWVEHAQFDDVASRVKDGMEILFDSDKPHFATWIGIYDIDYEQYYWHPAILPKLNPLYCAALCGFYDLVKHLSIKDPQHINAICGQYRVPLLAALSQDHVEIAELLLEHGANADVRETTGQNILFMAISMSHPKLVDIARFLLKHGADVNTRDDTLSSSLHQAEFYGHFEVAQMLIEHEADVNSQDYNGKTPMHTLFESLSPWTSYYKEDDVVNHARLLLEHGAEVNRQDNDDETLLHLAMGQDLFKLSGILLEHGADANAENTNGKTPLHMLSESWFHINDEGDAVNLTLLLLKHGAEVNRPDEDNETPLHLAIGQYQFELARILLEHGADANAENNNSETPLRILSESWIDISDKLDAVNLALSLLKHGAEVNRPDEDNNTPLHLAIGRHLFQLAEILLEHGADANAENNNGKTPLRILSGSRISDEDDVLNLTVLLLKHGAEVNRRDKSNQTPLHLAIGRRRFNLVGILLENGADANAQNNNGKTPLHKLLEQEMHNEDDVLNHALLFLKQGAEVNRRDKDSQTLLHLAMGRDWFKLAGILLEHGADANAENNDGKTPLCILSENWFSNERDFITWLFSENGVGTNRREEDREVPLLLGIGRGKYKFTQLLLSLAQMLPWRTTWVRPQCKKYHEANTTPGSVMLVLHNNHSNAGLISMRKTRT